MVLRAAHERGFFENDWLKSHHTFSFADYFDRQHMHFHDLRVINEDEVQPGAGFPTHGHRDMEIITYVYEGAVAHKDSMGNQEQLNAGEIQVMSAGQGVTHSEFNPHQDKTLKLLQIWILPNKEGLTPGYQQREFTREQKLNRLFLVAAQKDGPLKINQDVQLFASVLEAGKNLEFTVKPGRAAWIQLVRGELQVNAQKLRPGDGLAVEDAGALQINALGVESEFLLFDLVKI